MARDWITNFESPSGKVFMKVKTFTILVIVAGLLSGLAYLSLKPGKQQNQQAAMGTKLFTNFPVNSIATITISSPHDTVVLKKKQSFWVVENRYNFKADFSELSEMVKKIRDLKIGRRFKGSDESISRLALNDPADEGVPADKRGTRILLADESNKPVANFLMGSTDSGSAGSGRQYIMPEGQTEVYLVDKSFKFLGLTPDKWLEKEILKLEEQQVEKITCYQPGKDKPRYTLQRTGKDEAFALSEAPSEGKLDTYKVDRLARALSPLRIEDVRDPASGDKSFAWKTRIEYRLFNSTVYKIFLGAVTPGNKERYTIRAEVIIPPDTAGASETDSDLSRWTYIVDKWDLDSFTSDIEGLMKKEK